LVERRIVLTIADSALLIGVDDESSSLSTSFVVVDVDVAFALAAAASSVGSAFDEIRTDFITIGALVPVAVAIDESSAIAFDDVFGDISMCATK
jgi:hypothetical protein